jgi:hypothetical protein
MVPLSPGRLGGRGAGGLWPGRIGGRQQVSKPSFSPASLSPVLWLDASRGTFTDAGKTTPATNGDPVYTWADRSTSANDAVQATFAKRPTLATAGTGGKPALVFDGVDDLFNLTANLVVTGAFTLYVVGYRTSGTIYMPLGGPNGSSGFTCVTIFTDDEVHWLDDAPNLPGVPFTGTPGDLAFEMIRSGSSDPFHFTSNGMASAPLSGADTSDTTFNMVGSRGFGDVTVGKISAVLGFARQLSSGERASMAAYILANWGLSLP